ncbi:MAG: capsular biosynthesis protein [Rhodobacteraceae bacterium]|nr:capsular biosynthesis protein [Paracoccaceae bacterium]
MTLHDLHLQGVRATQFRNERRVFLFLQGHPSRFWPRLAQGLQAQGYRVVKVHFCLADALFWDAGGAISFRGRFSAWRGWLERLILTEGVTDVLYYADRQPYHVVGREGAEGVGCRTWAVEHGYLRPDWLTLEPGGMGPWSSFPRDRNAIEALAGHAPKPDTVQRYSHSFAAEATQEVSFHLSAEAGRLLYPFYRSDRAVWPPFDYLSWLPELVLARRREARAIALQREMRRDHRRYILVALQMATDYQIRAASPYRDLRDFLEEVISSFARFSPPGLELVVKLHPLDNGLGRWFARVARMALSAEIESRVHTVRGGNLEAWIAGSAGLVTVNSTTGIHALRAGVPVCALGLAIYDLPGLTHQAGLDRFWQRPEPVDRAFFSSFERALGTIQVKGSFYDPEGREAAVAEMVRRLQEAG